MARKTTSEIENEINQAKSWDDLKKIVKENYLGSQTFGMRLEQLCEIHHIGIQKLQIVLNRN